MRCILPFVAAALLTDNAPALAVDYVAMSGEQLYARFCASCHGKEGRGDGPVAASFTIEVPDLTLLARRAGGRFPLDRVMRIIDGRTTLGAHGARTMPVWGEDFGRAAIGDPNAERGTQIMIERLATHLQQLQAPPLQ